MSYQPHPMSRAPRWQSASVPQQQAIIRSIQASFSPESPIYIKYALVEEASQVFSVVEPPPWHHGVMGRIVAVAEKPGLEIFEDGLKASVKTFSWSDIYDIQAEDPHLAAPPLTPYPAYQPPYQQNYAPATPQSPIILGYCPVCHTPITILLADGRPYHPSR